MKNFLPVFLILILASCTTIRPLTLREVVAKAQRDTLLLKSIVVNNPIHTVEVASYKKDTLFIEKETRTETKTPYLDTALLSRYLEKYHHSAAAEIADLQALLLRMTRVRSDSVRVVMMQTELNASATKEKASKEVINASNQVIYEVPKYLYGGILSLILLLFLAYRYLKKKLKRKQAEAEKLNA